MQAAFAENLQLARLSRLRRFLWHANGGSERPRKLIKFGAHLRLLKSESDKEAN